MNDFPPFNTQPPMFEQPLAQQEPAKKQRGRPRKAKQPAASAAPAVPPKQPTARKKRDRPLPTAGEKANGDLRVPMSALVGITAEEIGLLEKMATAVHALPKKRRQAVAQALGRIFA